MKMTKNTNTSLSRVKTIDPGFGTLHKITKMDNKNSGNRTCHKCRKYITPFQVYWGGWIKPRCRCEAAAEAAKKAAAEAAAEAAKEEAEKKQMLDLSDFEMS